MKKPRKISDVAKREIPTLPRDTKYRQIFANMRLMKPFQSFEVQVNKNETPGQLIKKINAALSKNPITPPAGCRFRKYTAISGNVVIRCEKIIKKNHGGSL